MSLVVSKTFEFNEQDLLSQVFPQVKFVMIRFLDGSSLNTLCKASKFFKHLMEDPFIWQLKAQQLGLVYLDARLEVKAFCEMDESKQGTYAFAADLIGTLTPTDFRKIPYIGVVKSNRILINWPPDATIITGRKYETYLHRYMPYMAFSVLDQWTLRKEITRVILVIEQTTKVSTVMKEYLGRLLRGEPCGSWFGGREISPKLKRRKSVVQLCVPSHHENFSHFTGTLMPFGF